MLTYWAQSIEDTFSELIEILFDIRIDLINIINKIYYAGDIEKDIENNDIIERIISCYVEIETMMAKFRYVFNKKKDAYCDDDNNIQINTINYCLKDHDLDRLYNYMIEKIVDKQDFINELENLDIDIYGISPLYPGKSNNVFENLSIEFERVLRIERCNLSQNILKLLNNSSIYDQSDDLDKIITEYIEKISEGEKIRLRIRKYMFSKNVNNKENIDKIIDDINDFHKKFILNC